MCTDLVGVILIIRMTTTCPIIIRAFVLLQSMKVQLHVEPEIGLLEMVGLRARV